jgi:hypothetical protein
MPGARQDGLQKLSSVASLAGGLATGNPLAVAGGVKGLKGQPKQPQGVETPPDNAMTRRAQAPKDTTEKIKQLQAAEQALGDPELPQEIKDEIGPTLFHTMAIVAQEYKDQTGGR